MTIEDWVPLFVVLATGLVGLGTYGWQEHTKRRVARADHRRTLYEKLIRNMIQLVGASDPRERSRLISEIERGWLFASDEVLEACYELLHLYDELWQRDRPTVIEILATDDGARTAMEKAAARLLHAMRQGTLGDRRAMPRKSKIDAEWATDHFKIYDWGILSTTEGAQDDEAPSATP